MTIGKEKKQKRISKSSPYHHGNLKQALINAAVEILSTEGSINFTLREIARTAGVSHAAPYRHFSDKDALLAAVAVQGYERFHESLKKAHEKNELKPLLALRSIAIAYVRFAIKNPSHYRLMFNNAIKDKTQYPDLCHISSDCFQLVVDTIEHGQKTNKIRSDDARDLALSFWAIAHGLAGLFIDQQVNIATELDLMPSVVASAITSTLIVGLSPGTP